jgi:hypothetical protein
MSRLKTHCAAYEKELRAAPVRNWKLNYGFAEGGFLMLGPIGQGVLCG